MQRRRLLVMIALAFAIIAWGPRAAIVISDGWCSSCRALEQQRRIDATSRRLADLQRRVAYSRTVEGQDVEAKRRFGVGPDDEIWITVDAIEAKPERAEPQSVADRVNAWLTEAGGRFVDRVREAGAIISYWVGISEVDETVPVPVIEDEPPAEEAGAVVSVDVEAAADDSER